MNKLDKLSNILICPKCKADLKMTADEFICIDCQSRFKHDQSRIFLTVGDNYLPEINDKTIFEIKLFLKKFPYLYKFLCYFFGAPLVGSSPYKFIESFTATSTILNIGSGPKVVRKDVINLDIYPFPNVDLVADAGNIPIKNSSADAIICESLIEHVKNPPALISELYRILKPKGRIYLVAPFILSFHSSPNDFYRWTDQGLTELFLNAGFVNIKITVLYGPTSSLINIFSEWLAILLSFNSQNIHNFLYILFYTILSPIKFLDFILAKFNSSKNSALGFGITAEK
ncbi:MAG: methyltransferase domain-containing protein [Candidatus Buchananbacteria bacterium]